MITPRFSCSQNHSAVTIRIYTPAVRASDIEIHVHDKLFSLHISPYFLCLVFPGSITEDDASSADYDPTSGYLTVTLTKATPGEEFKDLDVLAKLLAPPKHSELKAKLAIEVIGSQDAELQGDVPDDGINDTAEGLNQREGLEAAENDWHLPQQIPKTPAESTSISVSTERRYGFLDAYTGFFKHVGHIENEVNELGLDIESLSPAERRQRRLKHEDKKWDEEYYIADYVDDEYIRELITYRPPPDAPFSLELPNPLVFTEQEIMEMLCLPRKEYLASSQQTHNLYLTLLTVLFSYAYDARTTQNDPTPESAWTVCNLTPAFSALDPPPYGPPTSTPLAITRKDMRETLVPSFRRSLAFPLYRNFSLAEQCLQDVSVILRQGCRAVLRALLATKRILEGHEVYYIYSKVWVEDFCRWTASDASEDILRSLGETLAETKIYKQSLGWDIPAREVAARQEANELRGPDSDDESEPEEVVRPVYEDADNNRVQEEHRDGIEVDEDGSASRSSSSSSASVLSSSSSSSESLSPDTNPSESESESESSSAPDSLDVVSSLHSAVSGL